LQPWLAKIKFKSNSIPDITGIKKEKKNVFESSMERRLEFKYVSKIIA